MEENVMTLEERHLLSKDILSQMLLTDFETGERLVIGADASATEDGKGISIICVVDENAKRGLRHTIYTEEVFQKSEEEKTCPTGLVDSDGEPI